MVKDHAQLSIVRQCSLLTIARSGLYYEKTGESAYNLALMQEIDWAFTERLFLGGYAKCATIWSYSNSKLNLP